MKDLFVLSILIVSTLFGQKISDTDLQTDLDSGNSSGQIEKRCGLSSPSMEEMTRTRIMTDEWLNERAGRDHYPVHVLVAWHVIHTTSNTGNLSTSAIEAAVQRLNIEYNEEHNIFFTLDTVTRTANNDWFYLEGGLYGEQEEAMRQSTYIDPYHYYNVWSCDMSGTGAGGWNYFPWWNPEGSYWQGTTVHYTFVNLSSKTMPHECGHYFGLLHTFEGGCTGGDQVADTPAQDDGDNIFQCNDNLDTCPDDPGNDPVHNIMNYASDACVDEFTPGQDDRMFSMIENFHPGLLENNFNFPNLYINGVDFQQDDDGDYMFNPGETVRVKVTVGNSWGGNAVNVVLTLSSEDPRIYISDDTIEFSNSIEAGDVTFTLLDWFLVSANPDATPGGVPCTVTITAGTEEYPYELVEEIELNLTLSQYGFPVEGIVIKSSPILADLDGNTLKDIYFGAENDKLYGYTIAGLTTAGFPFSTNDRVRSSPAIGDVDQDGSDELVFGTSSGKLYIVNGYGTAEHTFTQGGSIESAPVLVDIDGDQDLEIIFTTVTSNGGKVYVIHHDGSTETGFPVEIGRMFAGPAAHDLENDGIVDIVVGTYDDQVWALEAVGGNIKPGFPFTGTHRFNIPATIVDIDGDGEYEIAAGCDSGDLYVLNHDGSLFSQYDTGDDIRGGISVADLNGDGQLDLLFGGYDDHIHAWDPVANEVLPGWPVDLGSNSLTEPIIIDLDGDGQLEVVTARKNGKIYGFEADGSLMGNFPIPTTGDIETTPVVHDFDNDGDLELIFGTTTGLEVIDYKLDASSIGVSWSMYRSNLHRTGVYDISVMETGNEIPAIPEKFHVSANFPNPFNPTTQVLIDIPETGQLVVSVYDITGHLIYDVKESYLSAGRFRFEWSGRNRVGEVVPTGVYFISVEAGIHYHVQKIALVK